MANEAYVAKQVAEIARHPKALLLGAIGAICPTPSNSANVAEKELGLSKEEIQGVRWIALFKRGKTKLEFLNGLLEILERLEKTKEGDMGETAKAVSWYSGCTDLCPIPVKFPGVPEWAAAIVWEKDSRYEKFVLDQNKNKTRELLITFEELKNQPDLSRYDRQMVDELLLTGQVAFILPDGRRFIREDLRHDQAFLTAVKSL